jgi:hypothetical protein
MVAEKDLVPWSRVYSDMARRWVIGEHVMITAPTGVGKSVVAKEICTLRRNVVVIGTKREDDTMDEYLKMGYVRIYDWPPPPRLRGANYRYLLWPRIRDIDDVERYKPIYEHFLRRVFRIPYVTVVLDECQFMTEYLGLGRLIGVLLHQGRSGKLTLVSLSQRPVWVPPAVRSSASYVFLGRTVDQTDAQKLADFGGVDRRDMYRHLRALSQYPKDHQLLYVPSHDPTNPWATRVVQGTRLAAAVGV